MPSPFPGMDPFLESQTDWSSFHTAFMVDLSRSLLDILPPGFDARTEAHITVVFPENRRSGKPRTAARDADVRIFPTASNVPQSAQGNVAVLGDFQVVEPEVVSAREILQYSLKIVDGRSGEDNVVAVVEVLSPTNKDGRAGTADYRKKQDQILRSEVHLLEVDLLRGGVHAVFVPQEEIAEFGTWDYLVTLHDADHPAEYRFWRIDLQDRLPALLLPLTSDLLPIRLDLQETFTRCYDASRYARRLDYSRPVKPALSAEDASWVDGVLRAAGHRS